jgi:hypothetical protein
VKIGNYKRKYWVPAFAGMTTDFLKFLNIFGKNLSRIWNLSFGICG